MGPCSLCLTTNTDCRDVGVRMVDHGPDKSELPSGILDSRFSKYLRSFVTSGASIPESTASPLYMERNLPVSKGTEAMQGVHLLNGLECKICCATAKVRLRAPLTRAKIDLSRAGCV